MTVSAADAAGVAMPTAGSAGKRSAEGADVFAALVAGLLGALVAPGDLTGQQDQPDAQGQPGQPGELAIGAIGAAPAAAGVAVPAGPVLPVTAAVPAAPVDPAPPAAPSGAVVPEAAPAAPDSAPEQSDVPAPAAQAPDAGTPEGAIAAQAEGRAATQQAAQLPEVPAATTLPVAAPVGAAPVAVVQDVAAVAPTAPAAATPPAAPAAQVAAVVSPVLQGPDGSYRVTMHLHPEELGRVAVTVDLHQGSVSMHLHAAETGTGALLRDSLDDLRAELDRQGLSAGNLDVSSGDGGPGSRAARELLRATPRTDSDDSDAVGAPVPGLAVPTTSGRPSALDVQL